jgi:hypothetical protein
MVVVRDYVFFGKDHQNQVEVLGINTPMKLLIQGL